MSEQRLDQLERRLSELEREIAAIRQEIRQERLVLPEPEPVKVDTVIATEATGVNASSGPEAKIALFMERFSGRHDVYARRWTSRKTGKSGWSPATRQGFYSKDTTPKDYLPFTVDTVNAHLRRGGDHIGLYVMLPNDTCKLLACDFDDGTWKQDAAAFVSACTDHGIDALAEISRSGDGAHVWIFFDTPISAMLARRLGFAMLRQAMNSRPDMDMSSYDRFFPAQDTIATRANGSARLGNLIALPLNGDCRARNTAVFADSETWVPFEDPFAALAAITPLATEKIEQILATTQEKFGPEPEHIKRPTRAELKQVKANGETIKLTITNELSVPTERLPAAVIAEIKHRAVIPNPEFYRRQAQRFSTFGVPRIVIRFAQAEQRLLLPRGLVDDTLRILTLAGYKVSVIWPRQTRKTIDASFEGELRSMQQEGIDSLKGQRTGVLVAPPGAGKTVMACALIANRKIPTAVIVNRAELISQWRDRLAQYLSIDADSIGQIGAGRRKTTGIIDLITVQSLSRKDSDPKILEQYGQIIVDECHNIAAPGAEAALNQVKAPYWLGLTATPFRSDHMDEIITMQCGPVRHRMEVATDNEQRLIHIHETSFDSEETTEIQDLYNELAVDSARNAQITAEVHKALEAGDRCLVLVNRIAALEALTSTITESGDHTVLVMHGRQTQEERVHLRAQLASLSEKQDPFVLVAMNKVAGEGLDIPSLNTLFLAAPVSFKGLVIQQIGRVTRATGDQNAPPVTATVHDFVDSKIPTLKRMHGRRLRAMQKEGFAVSEP
ncbi:TOTE conflict system archaeo-eukaryotic primase domain-containing protein [Corynebacterium glutamicum]|uniref:TOTE conflict system archaeo-eukaryotic primase domain-containing protein n=1 Tax=Corynebacterium glutamicum TaxID=1718 RepID=UPI00117C1736|nr:DEAD/DEAH box helicase family protein [Corynebacterium glutamicum]QDQ21009.1 helicase [Corynebacterium glutamicum]QDQ24579.1 helicase [Corynebacterium glutamicum]